MSLHINGPLPISGMIPLYLPTDPNPTETLDLFLKGPGNCSTWPVLDSNWDEYDDVTWDDWQCSIASGIITNELNLYINGSITIPSSGLLNLYINPLEEGGTVSDNIDLCTRGPMPLTSNVPLFAQVEENPSGLIDLYIKGTDLPYSGFICDTLSLYSIGTQKIEFSGNVPLFLQAVSTGIIDASITLYEAGKGIDVSDNIDLYISNTYIEDSFNLFIRGYWSAFGTSITNVTNNTKGGGSKYSSSSTRTSSDPGSLTPDGITIVVTEPFDTRNNLIFTNNSKVGATPAYKSIPLYLHHVVGTGESLNLYTSGILWTDSNLNLHTNGANIPTGTLNLIIPSPLGEASGILSLNITGYF